FGRVRFVSASSLIQIPFLTPILIQSPIPILILILIQTLILILIHRMSPTIPSPTHRMSLMNPL
ncbi:MAG: hypothetical protein K2J72_10490, partial [Oscillospiraceae bacterium]|nr:hypothetical protein [Oscillospiraceae bacterium]